MISVGPSAPEAPPRALDSTVSVKTGGGRYGGGCTGQRQEISLVSF